MGEEAAAEDDYDLEELLLLDDQEEDRVVEWEAGLPGPDELTPLSQPLVPPGLAAAFRIHPEPGRTLLDVHRASAETLARLTSSSSFQLQFIQQQKRQAEEEEEKKKKEVEKSNKSNKKDGGGRLVWTPQLHKRFVDVVAHLGMKKAVPKTIMELMNVEGLTRENVASHLQKYRLYVKRMQHQDDDDGPSLPSVHQVHQQQLVPAPPSHPYAMYPIPIPMAGINSSSYQHQHQQMSGYQYHYANK